jgi:hypothetical protein
MKYIKNDNNTNKSKTEKLDTKDKKTSVILNDTNRFKSKIIISERDKEDNLNDFTNENKTDNTPVNSTNKMAYKSLHIKEYPKENQNKIKRIVKKSSFSLYFINSMKQIKHFFHKYKKNMSIFYSTLSVLFCIIFAFVMIFSFTYNKKINELNDSSHELSEYQNILTKENMKYFKEILQNPSIFTIIDSNRYLENSLFNYSVTISYANNRRTYTTIDEPTKALSFNINSGNIVSIEFTETYTKIAQELLDIETLKLYSLFVSPLKNENNNSVLRDYRSFLTIGDAQYYNYFEVGSNIPNFTVNTAVTNTSNSYIIKMNNFVEQENGYLPYLYLETNADSKNNRKLTTEADLQPVSSNFPLVLADNTEAETVQILKLLNSCNENNSVELNDIKDYLTNLPTKGNFENLINLVISKNETSKGILNLIGGEDKYYLEGLKNIGALQKLGQTAILKVENIINNIIAFSSLSDIESIISKYQANGPVSPEEKTKIMTYQAFNLIKKSFGLDYVFTDTEKATLLEIKENTSKFENLTELQEQLIDKILDLYSEENIYKISLVFYKLKSLIKTFDFSSDTKLNMAQLIIRRQVTGY